MEGIASAAKDGGGKLRGRLMGKLFKEEKEKKTPTSQDEVNDFLRGPSDKLQMMPSSPTTFAPPQLSRIDTGKSSRWPTAAEVQNSRRRRSASPKRSRKGLVVRFSDEQPEVIGEGGDEALSPVTEIRPRVRSHTHPPVHQREHDTRTAERSKPAAPGYEQTFESQSGADDFRPGPMRRTQTGFESIPSLPEKNRSRPELSPMPKLPRSGHDNRSFSEKVKEEMKSREGLALVRPPGGDRMLSVEHETGRASTEMIRQMDEVQLNTRRNSHIPAILQTPIDHSSTHTYMPNELQVSKQFTESPAASSRHSPLERARSQDSHQTSEHSTTSKSSSVNAYSAYQAPNTPTQANSPTLTLQDATLAVVDDALRDFSGRTSHLFNLFCLSAEAVKPISAYSLEDVTKAAFWWFIKGRCQLESTIRERPSSAEAQQKCNLMRQQSHTNLAKSLWLSETVVAQQRNDPASNTSREILDCRQVILSSLRKLAMSMKRNNILPPDSRDAPLSHGLDTSIWTPDDGNRSLLASQRTTSLPNLSEAYPLGDTSRTFHFGRMFADAILLEETVQYRCPVLLSMVRNQDEHGISLILVNQNSTLTVVVKSEKHRGTTWNDVSWQAKLSTIEINLPRGFLLRVRLSDQDFRLLWGTYDHESRTHAMLATRDGEELVFETGLRTFQCFSQTPSTGLPKEPQPDCHLRVFETSTIRKAASGPRKMHRGFRLALNTNSKKTKNLRGVDQLMLPNQPIQYGFLRGDGGSSAFLLKMEDDESKTTIVNTFENVDDRTRLHALLNGSGLGEGEDVVAEAQITGMSIITTNNTSIGQLEKLEWQNFKVINYDKGSLQHNKTVLSHHLRVVLDFKTGTLTDRINVDSGELRIRLDVNSQTKLKVLRQAQKVSPPLRLNHLFPHLNLPLHSRFLQ